jgi:endonuclease/exonuclease/phosphatase family metal-dependent hydrolase
MLTVKSLLTVFRSLLSGVVVCFCLHSSHGQSNLTVRVMAANLNGNTQSIQPFEVDLYKGLKPDVVCIQEFNYNNNTAADFRALIDDAFGTNFSYYRETGSLQIPNGIISRYPIIASGRWVDTQVSNRGFAWAQIELPGSNDLYVVSVHLLTSGSGVRGTEASNLKALLQANFPANAWLVIGGDFNTDSRSETAITTLASLCPDVPIPTDAETGGNYNSNANRNKPYDYVLGSRSLTNYLTNVVFASHSFARGLVFDSRVYTPLSDVGPVVYGDSGQGQHMAILKDFLIPVSGSNAPSAPLITAQPQSQIVAVGLPATFNVSAAGSAPLSYQWRFNDTNLSGANASSYSIASAQTTDNGSYLVVITNLAGAVTSAVAVLTVSNTPPVISTQPADLAVYPGETAAFSVAAGGAAPLVYQWRFNGTNLAGASNADYSFNNVQTNQAGNYTVVITNLSGSVTSAVAVLTVENPAPVLRTQPVGVTVTQGASATFSVTASGASPLDYQWRFNGSNLPGATTNPFTIGAAQLADAGNYSVVVTNLSGSATSAVATLTVNAVPTGNPVTLAGWDVSTLTSQNFGPSPMAPTTNAPVVTVGGLTRGSGVTATGTAGMRTWGGNGFDSASLSSAATAGDYVTFSLAANAGYRISFTSISKFDYKRSSSGPTTGVLQFQVGAGPFTPVSNFSYSSTTGASLAPIDLSGYAELQNVGPATTVTFRIVNCGASSSGGNWYLYDLASSPEPDLAVQGLLTAIAPPAAPVLAAAASDGGIQINLTGTSGASYVLQSATNLFSPHWILILTNAAPFNFRETNLTGAQKFYRAVAQ